MVEKLEQGGMVYFNPRGTSMLPMLHNDGDMVKLIKPDGQLKKYDLPLYRRTDGAFVLHRVVGINSDGTYTMCGDNQWRLENGISHGQIVGKVVAFKRNGKEYTVEDRGYKAYCRVWVAVMPLRHIVFGGFNRIKRLAKRLVSK
jgi:hypothetical protein